MKSIKLMFLIMLIGMISLTACSESEQMQEQTKSENKITNKDEFVWIELEDLEKREQVISTVIEEITGVECSTCKGRCHTVSQLASNSWSVACDGDSGIYSATNCNGTWHVTYFPRGNMDGGLGFNNALPYPCP